MPFPYAKVFKQAYVFIRTKKFLWTFGLFFLWGNFFVYGSMLTSGAAPQSQGMSQSNTWVDSHQAASNWIGLALLAAFGVFLYFYLRARAGITLSVKDLIERKPTGFSQAMRQGKAFSPRLFGIWFATTLAAVAALAVISIPVFYLLWIGLTYRAWTLAVFGAVIFVPALLIANFVNIFGTYFAVAYQTPVKESLKGAFDLFSKFWLQMLLMGVMLIAVGFAGFFASLFAGSVIASPFVLLGRMPYYIGGYGISGIISGVGTVLGIGVVLFLTAILSSFQQVCWILVFLELVKPKKTEAPEEAVVAAEPIS